LSIKAIIWALQDAPVDDPTQALILCAMAETAHDDGTEARASQATYAKYARCSERTLRRHIKAMEETGVIIRGDQRLVEHLRPDRRPVVWNLAIWMNRTTGQTDRPDIERPDTGVPSVASRGVNYDSNGRTRVSDKPSTEPSLNNEPSNYVAEGSEAHRDDVESLCQELADLIVANGSRRPAVTKKWRDAARLMLDRDGIPFDMIMGAIRWSQGNDFWKAHILSMPKLRDKYDTMRLQSESGSTRRVSTTDRKLQEGRELAEWFRSQGR
jgi:hypothetical protein